MKVTQITRDAFHYRRQKRRLERQGYEQITCAFGIGNLWQLDRGSRYNWRIVEAVVGVDGESVFVKAVPFCGAVGLQVQS